MKRKQNKVVRYEDKTNAYPKCNVRVQENPKTGKIELIYSKECSKEYLTRIAGKIQLEGLHLRQECEEDEEV